MSLEAIKTISDAEENAKQKKAKAMADQKKELAEAEHAGQLAIDAAVKKAEDELRELIKKADEKVKLDAEQLSGETENKKAVMRAQAEGRIDAAASLIAERIVNS